MLSPAVLPPAAPPPAELFTLPNGLKVAAQTRPGAAFALRLRLPWGSAHDPLGEEGAAGVLEEWVFKGAGGRSARALADTFDAQGLRLSSGVGAEATSMGLSGLGEGLGAALHLLADVVIRPELPDAELTVLSDLARQDLEGLRDSPADALDLQFWAGVMGGATETAAGQLSGFGHPSSGTLSGLAALTPETLRAAYAHWGARGSLLAVVADCRPAEIRTRVEDAFGAWGPGAAPVQVEPHFHAGYAAHIPHAGSEQTHLRLAWPAPAAGHPDRLPSQLALEAFSGGSASRLFQAVREERGLAYFAEASAITAGTQGFWLLDAASTPGRAGETLAVLQQETEQLRWGLTAREFERARRTWLISLAFAEEKRSARVRTMLHELLVLGRLRLPGEQRAQIEALTLEGVNEYLAAVPDPLDGAALLTLGREPLQALGPHRVELTA